MNKLEKHKLLKYTAHQLIDNGDFQVLELAFSKNYLAHASGKKYKGHTYIKRYIKELRKAFPNLKVLNIEIISQADNILTWQRVLSGTHKVSMRGILPSNKKIKWYELVVSRFEKGRVVEEWIASDLAFQMMLKVNRSSVN